jgi:large subunit ribosomal protein L21
MYAIVDIAGQQFKVEKDQKIFVHRQKGEEGSALFFNNVLLIDTGKKVTVGTPVIPDALVSAKILAHLKGDKVKVFKKKRRKGYQVLKGHRQLFTEIQISDILEKGGSKAIMEPSKAKPEKATVAKGAKAKESEVKAEIPVKKTPEVVVSKEPVKKSTGKTAGKTKTLTEKKSAAGKKDTEKQTGKSKSKVAPVIKSSKSKATKENPAKKAKKSTDK